MKEGRVKKPFYKRWWFFLLVAIVVIGVIGNMGDDDNKASTPNTKEPVADETNNDKADVQKEASEVAEITITAPELSKAFEENEVKANQDYKGKTLEITGTIKNIGESFGSTYIVLDSGEDFSITDVQCFFKDEAEIAKIAEMGKGAEVTLVGKVDGKSMNVTVRNCKFK